MNISADDVYGATQQILDILRPGDQKVIYFSGFSRSGFGVAPVLRSIAQELRLIKDKKTPAELCFDRIIYIDCSAWESRRVMQRKIAEELELDIETMAIFDKQDEEDDFSGKDHGSRDLLRSISAVIDQTVGHSKFMMIFLNGSDEEVDVSRFGINPEYRDHTILWTFKRQSLTAIRDPKIAHKLRYTDIHISVFGAFQSLSSSQQFALLREEAANIVARHPWMPSINIVTMVTKCCLYELFMQYGFHRATGFDWAAHASNYWMCDGIIKWVRTREISSTLHQEINWEIDDALASSYHRMFYRLMRGPEAPFFIVKDDTPSFLGPEAPFFTVKEDTSSFLEKQDNTPLLIKRPYPWISVTSRDLIIHEDTDKALLAKVSSLFLALGKPDDLQGGLPDGVLKHFSNLGVLILSRCAFSFVSPPFLWCHGLRFLGLDHCSHDNTSEGENNAKWTWLQNLWVLDLRYTEWDDILSQDKIDNMDKLKELNIEGFMCWQLAARFHGKLLYLQRLRVIKPMNKADKSADSSSLFVDKTELEILDLSGNRDMKKLSICSSVARSLQMLILDGCNVLENVVVPDGLPSSLRSFSFDGYGPATRWTSSFKLPPKSSKQQKHNPDADTSAAKTTKISLRGCTQLENLFVRGLPNLEELDLSGSPIKVLDFETMVVDVPGLKRLILLGCEHLCFIKWGSIDSVRQLELLFVDTRPWRAHGSTRSCLAQHKSHYRLQLHATLADARLARSLRALLALLSGYNRQTARKEICFNIHVTSSSGSGGGVQLETTGEEMVEPSIQHHQVQVTMYSDASFKTGVAPMLSFPEPPTLPLDHHIEISDESRGLDSELERSRDEDGLVLLMTDSYATSLHVHDASTSSSMPAGRLEWCRIERCPNLDVVFSEQQWGNDYYLHTVWASHLLKARCIWSQAYSSQSAYSFDTLQYLHLRSCPRLQFVLPVWVDCFPSLETIHIIHCSDLTHVLVLNKKYPEEIAVQGLPFPKLTTIHLYDLPKLQQICEVKMLAPALETIRIRGCSGLRRLPTVMAREPGAKKPTVEIEKDVWDALEWDGLAAGHHPDLFEPPVHSRYYRRSRLLRGTVLR